MTAYQAALKMVCIQGENSLGEREGNVVLVIRNAKIYTCAGKIYEQADILIDGQKIAAIGENLDVPLADKKH